VANEMMMMIIMRK